MEQQRHIEQQAFVDSGANIEIGDLHGIPINLEELKNTSKDSHYVLETFHSGLTANVFHIQFEQLHWTLKVKRPISLVNNIDGQTSFLNEVQRRKDLTQFKKNQPEKFKHIVETKYASFTDGIILSPWIEGQPIVSLNVDHFEQIFSTIVNLELNGLFEWDLCSGNILLDSNNEIKLFDFGYMYRFEPKTHFNSNGCKTPIFHGVERFETRFFFDLLLKNTQQLNEAELFDLYKTEKHCALRAYQKKLQKLIELGADRTVLTHQHKINQTWQRALLDDKLLQALYLLESFRSNILDLLDDIHGQSCTSWTLKKADMVLHMLAENFAQLVTQNAFFFGDEDLTQGELIIKYQKLRSDAEHFQLSNVSN